MSETKLKLQVLRYLKSIPGMWVAKVADKFTSGYPDIFICYKSGFVGIELKVPGKDATPIQHYVMKEIRAAGGKTAVCHSLDEVKEFMNEAVLL